MQPARPHSPVQPLIPIGVPPLAGNGKPLAMNAHQLNVEDIYELTPLQQEWASSSDVRQVAYRLRNLDVSSFRQAWEQAAKRHPVLRTSIHRQGLSKALQVVHKTVERTAQTHDWRGKSSEEASTQLMAFLETDRTQAFSLATAPLHRFALFRLDGNAAYFVWSYHPLILDRESASVVFEEVVTSSNRLKRRLEPELPPAGRFRDYAVQLQQRGTTAAEEFWRKTLHGFTVPTGLPEGADARAGGSIVEERLVVPPPLMARIREVSQRYEVSIGTLLQGAWVLLLGSSTRRGDDVIFGLAAPSAASRTSNAVLAGPFHNTLPIRVRVDAKQPIGAWLKKLQARVEKAQSFAELPASWIRSCSEVPPGASLFDSMLVMEPQRKPSGEAATTGLIAEPIPVPTSKLDCPLVLTVAPGPSGLALRLEHGNNVLDPKSGERLLARFRSLLASLSSAPANATLVRVAPMRPERGASLVCLRASGNRPPLFCVHPAGGNSLGYGSLTNRLGPDQPVYAFEARGLDGRERPHQTIEEMASFYLETLRRVQPNGSIQLAGWSSGGLIAFEMARQLKNEGREVGSLSLFDTVVPAVEGEGKPLTPRKVLRRLAQQIGLDLRGREDLQNKSADELPALLIAEARAASLLPPGFGEAELRRLVRLYRIHVDASRAFVPQSYPGRAILFRAAESVSKGELPAHLGWEGLASSIDLRIVPGDHNTLLREPHVKALADELANCLLPSATAKGS